MKFIGAVGHWPHTTVFFRAYLGMSFLLVTSGKLAATEITRKWLLPRMRSNVRGEVVAATEGAHANATLERLLSGVYPDVASQLVATRKAPVARVDGTRVWPLMHGRFGRSVRVLSRLDWQQFDRNRAVLVCLTQNLVAFAC